MDGSTLTIENCRVKGFAINHSILSTNSNIKYMGGILGWISNVGDAPSVKITDCQVSDLSINVEGSGGAVGGVLGGGSAGSVKNCITSGEIYCTNESIGGVVGSSTYAAYACIGDIDIYCNSGTIGGIQGGASGNAITMTDSQYSGTIYCQKPADSSVYIGGLMGSGINSFKTCSFDGKIRVDIVGSGSGETMVAGIVSRSGTGSTTSKRIQYCTVNGDIVVNNGDSSTYIAGIHFGFQSYTITGCIVTGSLIGVTINSQLEPLYYYPGSTQYPNTASNCYFIGESTKGHTTSLTSELMKHRSSFSALSEFDTYYIINEYINNGYPTLKWTVDFAEITGFDGSGTEADPYQIKTTADIQGMAEYYNENDIIDEYYWILMNDIDISTDTLGLSINWTPIGYEGGVLTGFNGHFDGNGKTISGLNITEQYANVGLFGKMSATATITNLNVTGNIAWDQAKYVGGLVGYMEIGGRVTECSFIGTITGYLNSSNRALIEGLVGNGLVHNVSGTAQFDAYIYGENGHLTFMRHEVIYE